MKLSLSDDELYQAYLEKIYVYQQIECYSDNIREEMVKKGICITYGELLYYSVKKILQILQPTKEDIFLDLGSGLGKCALQVFMQSDVQKVFGIEASPKLHEQAILARGQLLSTCDFFWQPHRTLDFYCDNFLTHPWLEATLVYTCSTCFTRELLEAIGEKINQAPQVKKVLSLRALPTLTRLPLHTVFGVECSWDSALCYYYAESG